MMSEMGFKMNRLFQVSDGERIAWALHTSMNLDKKYAAALLTMQHGDNDVHKALTRAKAADTAFFYDANTEVTLKGSVPSTLPISNIEPFLHPVNQDGQRSERPGCEGRRRSGHPGSYEDGK